MPAFDTPEPITADIAMTVGALQITATDRAETTVEVRPADPAKDVDVRVAEQTEVVYANGHLSVRTAQGTGLDRVLGRGAVDLVIALPEGSRVQARGSHAAIRCQGRLGPTGLTSSSGNITLERATGNTELSTSHGWIRAEEIDGRADVRTTSGTITLGTVTGDLTARSAHGAIAVDHALGSVAVRTTHGSARIGETVRGSVDLESSFGELEVGIREGTAAWLDATSRRGVVRITLEAAEAPDTAEETVRVRARNDHGDVLIRHA